MPSFVQSIRIGGRITREQLAQIERIIETDELLSREVDSAGVCESEGGGVAFQVDFEGQSACEDTAGTLYDYLKAQRIPYDSIGHSTVTGCDWSQGWRPDGVDGRLVEFTPSDDSAASVGAHSVRRALLDLFSDGRESYPPSLVFTALEPVLHLKDLLPPLQIAE